MSKEKTFVTEISIAHGITNHSMGIKNLSVEHEAFYNESVQNHLSLAENFKNIGKKIRTYLSNKNLDCSEITWCGLNRQLGKEEIASQDLKIFDYPISIKENSHVLINGSASKIFELIPAGIIERGKRSKNWYLHVSPELFNQYFELCANELNFHTKFYKNFIKLSKPERKVFTYAVRELHNNNIPHIVEAYNKLCKDVSEKSAILFNNLIEQSKTNPETLKTICQEFFRIDKREHFLAGIDHNETFVCLIPSFEEWNNTYEILSIQAEPLEKGQPEVNLLFSFKNKTTEVIYNLTLKAEIRWSHGKFSGNPEAKIYKCWKYSELPWAKKID